MTEITHNLFVGDDSDCASGLFSHIIHACKTCHQTALSYRDSLQSTHPNYLIYETESDLYLNMVDMERELLPLYTNPIMFAAMNFLDKYTKEHKILVHCNQGFSRSPSIVLLYCARKKIIPSTSYHDALKQFIELFPQYNPGRGIALYMEHNFQNLVEGTQ
ncbi:MAG TPA: dual specificity protein phosphatase family protein [Clostridiales bacterium]|nr:dual specificity protein phosphatase family protein [Clostridiales bacterium]